MYVLELTKDELSAGIVQINARLDELAAIQKECAYKGDVKRVLEIEEFSKPIHSLKNKMMDILCK